MPITPKPAIQTIEQQTTPHGERQNLRFNPMSSPALMYQQIGENALQVGAMIQKMQDRNDKLAMGAFEQKLADNEKTLELQLKTTNSPEEVDSIYEAYQKETLMQAEQALGKRLYKKWRTEAGDTYLEVTRQMTQRAKFPIMQRAGANAVDAALDMAAKNRTFATTPEEKQAADSLAFQTLKYAAFPQDGSPAVITSEKAQELAKKYQHRVDNYELQRDIETSPMLAIKNLKTDGKYPSLTLEERQKSINTLRKQLGSESQTVHTNPEVYVRFENDIDNGTFNQTQLNLAYTRGQITLADKRTLEAKQEKFFPSARSIGFQRITAKFSAGDNDAKFGQIMDTRQKATESFRQLLELHPNASDKEVLEYADRVIDQYQIYDNDLLMQTLPVPNTLLAQGYDKRGLNKLTSAQILELGKKYRDQVQNTGADPREVALELEDFNKWYKFAKNREERQAKRAAQEQQGGK